MVAIAGGEEIPLAAYAPFGSRELSENVLKALAGGGGSRAALMAHHGLVVFDASPQAALALAFEIEELAAQYVIFRALGMGEILDREQMREVRRRFDAYRRGADIDDAGEAESRSGDEEGQESA
jgi:L-fuculose-phosphate aldolase